MFGCSIFPTAAALFFLHSFINHIFNNSNGGSSSGNGPAAEALATAEATRPPGGAVTVVESDIYYMVRTVCMVE